jgi:chorismate dehydratase
MPKINVSVVSYANSIPFVYGLINSKIKDEINLSLDNPAACADKVINGTADIGLIPIIETLRLKSYEIISNLCIGANDYVKTVLLASDIEVHDLSDIYLDYQSRTSVVLVKVLSQRHWKINPNWIPASQGFETKTISEKKGAVIIGDRTFFIQSKYKYDLAHEWKLLTGLPFVFAAWVANKKLDSGFKERFNQALHFGTNHIEASTQLFKSPFPDEIAIVDYLKNNIDYSLDDQKNKAMQLFLDYSKEFVSSDQKLLIHKT